MCDLLENKIAATKLYKNHTKKQLATKILIAESAERNLRNNHKIALSNYDKALGVLQLEFDQYGTKTNKAIELNNKTHLIAIQALQKELDEEIDKNEDLQYKLKEKVKILNGIHTLTS